MLAGQSSVPVAMDAERPRGCVAAAGCDDAAPAHATALVTRAQSAAMRTRRSRIVVIAAFDAEAGWNRQVAVIAGYWVSLLGPGLGQVASQTRREGSEQRRRSGSYAEHANDRATKYGDAN